MNWNDIKTKLTTRLNELYHALTLRDAILIESTLFIFVLLALYLARIHPYLIYIQSGAASQHALNMESTETLRKHHYAAAKTLETWWHTHTINENDIPKVIDLLSNPNKGHTTRSIKVGEILDQSDYRTVSIETSFEGDFPEMVSWLGYLETLPIMIEVESISISPHPNEALFDPNRISPVLSVPIRLRAILKPSAPQAPLPSQ